MFEEKFYDIEAFMNLFTCSVYNHQQKIIEVYYLWDNISLNIDINDCTNHIKDVNISFMSNTSYKIEYLDLHIENNAKKFASEFVKLNIQNYPLFLNDTDNDYDKNNGYNLYGYNSANYDLTMLAYYFGRTFVPTNIGYYNYTNKVTAYDMYKFNNTLFDKYINHMSEALGRNTCYSNIYWSMLNSGRHIDVSNLNEKQSKVALKRLLGILGYQIKESDILNQGNKAAINTLEMFYEAIAYNISDILGLEKLFRNDIYASAYELKEGLLEKYPELIYKKDKYEYKPDIKQNNIKRGRLRIDSTSANFATNCLCPYGRLKDIPEVSFIYPSKEIADKLGIEQINVLDSLYNWYCEQFKDYPDIINAFKNNIYGYYKQIEGKNFNSGENYISDYGRRVCYSLSTLNPIDDKTSNPVPFNGFIEYYNDKGQSTGCYAQFSIGGIHGAEYNLKLYEEDIEDATKQINLLNMVKRIYPNPYDLRCAKTIMIEDTVYPYTAFLKSGAKIKNPDSCIYKEISLPQLYKEKKDNKTKKVTYILNERYTYTSSAICDHEDFSSYYPNLLIKLLAMYNAALGYDRYEEIYNQKEMYGQKTKDKSLSDTELRHYNILRGGTKLVLNSASGTGDLTYDTPIRMNNKIISMRLIGQFFTFWLAQAQALVGAKIPSTNTDGIYVNTPNKDITRKILKDMEKIILVDIEPEEMWLISKDTNNRLEISADGQEILNASGGTLACYKQPSPDKALSHPAIIDNALVTYLQAQGMDLTQTPSIDDIKLFLKSYIDYFGTEKSLIMFQNIISSSRVSDRYITLVNKDITSTSDIKYEDCTILQHYNRMYFVKKEYSNQHLVIVTHKNKTQTLPLNNTDARKVLSDYGINIISDTEMASFIKIPGINITDSVKIYNKAIINNNNKEELENIVNELDLDIYAQLIQNKYIDCWKNNN